MSLFIPESNAFYMASDEEVIEYFQSAHKCKYKGKVTEIYDLVESDTACHSYVHIGLKNNFDIYYIQQMGFEFLDCIGGNSNLITEYHMSNLPKKGDTIYGILNSENGTILRAGKSYFDSYSDIPLCEGGALKEFEEYSNQYQQSIQTYMEQNPKLAKYIFLNETVVPLLYIGVAVLLVFLFMKKK